MHWRFKGHQSYVVLCTETALSNHPAVIPKSSCDVHLLRSPWLDPPKKKFHNQSDISVLYSNEGVHFIVEMNSGNGYLSEIK